MGDSAGAAQLGIEKLLGCIPAPPDNALPENGNADVPDPKNYLVGCFRRTVRKGFRVAGILAGAGQGFMYAVGLRASLPRSL